MNVRQTRVLENLIRNAINVVILMFYDVGASQASQCRDNRTAGKAPNTNFEITLKLLRDLK